MNLTTAKGGISATQFGESMTNLVFHHVTVYQNGARPCARFFVDPAETMTGTVTCCCFVAAGGACTARCHASGGLSPYEGLWVALRDGRVVASHADPVQLKANAVVADDDVLMPVPKDRGSILIA